MVAFATCAFVGFLETPLTIVQKVKAEARRAFLKKDYAAYERLLTTDFVSIDPSGKRLDKRHAIVLERVDRERIVKIEDIDSRIQRVWYGEGGIFEKSETTLVAQFKDGRSGLFLVTSTEVTESLLVLRDGSWRFKKTRILGWNWRRGRRKSLV